MPQKRLAYLDMAKGVGIFLVVLGHIEYIEENTLKWIFSFHMPLFFIIGGILFYTQREKRQSVFRKVQGILTPYLSFSLMLLTVNGLTHLQNPNSPSAGELLRQLVDTFSGYGVHILWFLPAYFIGNALFLLLNRRLSAGLRNLAVILLAAAAFVTAKSLGLDQYAQMECSLLGYAGFDLLITVLRGLLALPFLLTGWYLGALEAVLFMPKDESRAESGRWLCLALSLLMLPGAFLAVRLPVFDLHYLYVEPIHYLTAGLSCTGLLCLMRALPESRVLSWLGRNSLVIMCTHAAFFVIYYVSLGMFFFKKWIPMSWPAFNLGVAVLVCVAEIPIVYVFNRWFGRLLGRSSQ